MSGWDVVIKEFHDRVRANCWEPLVGEFLNLHQPHLIEVLPVCQGCDRDNPDAVDPIWPCRTYTIIAKNLLNIPNVEDVLRAMLAPGTQRRLSMNYRPTARRGRGSTERSRTVPHSP